MSIGTVFGELLGKPDTMSWDVISHLGLEMARKCQKLHGCGWDLELTATAASEPCKKEFSNRGFMKADCKFKWRLSYKVARQKKDQSGSNCNSSDKILWWPTVET